MGRPGQVGAGGGLDERLSPREGDALDELHHDIVKNALVHDVVDADHVGVGKPGSRLGLDLKFADKTGVVAELSL